MNLDSWRLSPSATEIELLLGRWFAEQFGLPQGSGGLIVSGGAMANFVALAAAHDNKAGWDVRAKGVFAGPPLVLYASQEVHVVTDRAADMLGLGTDAVRKIPVDGDYRIRVAELEAAIKRDKDAGLKPFAVVANAGTVATGAIDDIGEIASICAAEELGCTSTLRTVAQRSSPTTYGRFSLASKRPTRSPSTPTNGSTPLTPAAVSSCETSPTRRHVRGSSSLCSG